MIGRGRFKEAARGAYLDAVHRGYTGFGPAIYAELFSYGSDPWVFQGTIAEVLGCKVRTVQRWLARFRRDGLLQCWTNKPGEVPKGREKPLRCRWSHRWLTAWHVGGSRLKAEIQRIIDKRAKRLLGIRERARSVNRAFAAKYRELAEQGLRGAELETAMAAAFPGPPE